MIEYNILTPSMLDWILNFIFKDRASMVKINKNLIFVIL